MLIEELDIPYVDIEKKTGIPKSTIQRYASGTTKKIPIDAIETLASVFGVSPAYLMGWGDTNSTVSPVLTTHNRQVPLVGRIAAGQPIEAIEDVEEWLTIDEQDSVDFALRVHGDSMTGVGIYDGDILYVRNQSTVNNGEIAVISLDNGFPDSSDVTCKRFYQYGDTVALRPESHNPVHKEQVIKLGEDINVRILGKVVFLKSHIENR